MELLNDLLTAYLEKHTDPEPELAAVINRETHLKETRPHMLSGHYQGRLLSIISKLVAPRCILEVGTFTGYATLCLAEGLTEGGVIHTIDIEEEREDRVRDYFSQSAYSARIRYHLGDALKVIPSLTDQFDLVFIDADKQHNQHYYDLVIDRMPTGGVILIDNVLWKGKVLAPAGDKQTAAILKLNEYIAADQRVEKIILPVRDGLFFIRKL